jgi:hypothetical protein
MPNQACRKRSFHSIVMVALVATIHDFLGGAKAGGRQKKSWMPVTSTGMTVE